MDYKERGSLFDPLGLSDVSAAQKILIGGFK